MPNNVDPSRIAAEVSKVPEWLTLLDNFLGLGVYTVPVVLVIVAFLLKWSIGKAIKIILIATVVLIALKYPVLSVVKSMIG
ncbi:TPA: hypothetical protein DDW69_03155 [candidate division CPR2 bacterium]|uniref:Uncharacterized protein n=1 Tax=candidate division CPR2 bacterium GW2011_GWC1_41_48 TaxID=1618344 RepID=A0A0G0Z7X5_UNCC2|nr:MAG: hypothetical protein UT47_C0003G0174 [candidate division CPR2 bacterium GW2011_GWC2_39_35]KKR27369.1 MAG: hypothetical protein UT59_C0059G0004 [candidate division CPR2 bacterium GW2011_GWD1_39_7]KKR27666.1 MAG: hypothetical protein UT60_C0041G0004 [candidate division CPR2 bacterium GW2011_GWD2_39_7]KKS09113.1 MAG: hypothetical protein UU65_C0003G0168 [candidate division CPR2 bacterium GW2011_GWC1_41_48]OGB58386.1 MAG: hypothetical protein A2Y27_03265 [candidate division CPR2 bacterium G